MKARIWRKRVLERFSSPVVREDGWCFQKIERHGDDLY
jgi:hypothetical protein